jgi:hypothetical protein
MVEFTAFLEGRYPAIGKLEKQKKALDVRSGWQLELNHHR